MSFKVTKEHLEELIHDVRYERHGDTTTTVCYLHVGNPESPFVVTGTSGCISKENFCERMGKQIAYANAFDELWKLEGYHQKRSRGIV
ncbi:Gp49 family protein [Parendozoicomonas haliclonae]|uniref:Phage protein n=1 Tax=Parendozoicomonas haliclonae TaxID=1960125 RepID=A0A1X7AE48_9GAMM|nr:Gp49 family protein [Parendozoicomonas haliclonae]SMA33358.1 hypothetical protein EHSB41UT_00268 [Parendozoicomonas haliclonae]